MRPPGSIRTRRSAICTSARCCSVWKSSRGHDLAKKHSCGLETSRPCKQESAQGYTNCMQTSDVLFTDAHIARRMRVRRGGGGNRLEEAPFWFDCIPHKFAGRGMSIESSVSSAPTKPCARHGAERHRSCAGFRRCARRRRQRRSSGRTGVHLKPEHPCQAAPVY